MRSTRTAFALVAALATLLLAGCGRDARPTAATTGETYTVEHVFGTTEVPADAVDRVVVLHPGLLDAALAAGVTPIAAPRSFQGFANYLPDVEVASLGDSEDDIGLELIGQQDPGLILVNVGEGDAVEDTQYAELSAIAPTVPVIMGQHDFENVAAQAGRALNRVAEMDAAGVAYHERAAAIRDELATVPAAALPVSQVRLREDHVRMMMEETNAGRVMAEVGLTFAPPLPGAEWDGESGTFYSTSLELLPEATGDYAFVYSTDEGVLESVRAMPVWQTLTAVQNGTVYEVDFEPWMRGQGYLAAHAVLDDIAAAYGVDQARQ